MTRQLIQHMIEEPDARVVGVGPCPVEVDFDADLGLCGRAIDGGLAHMIISVFRALIAGQAVAPRQSVSLPIGPNQRLRLLPPYVSLDVL